MPCWVSGKCCTWPGLLWTLSKLYVGVGSLGELLVNLKASSCCILLTNGLPLNMVVVCDGFVCQHMDCLSFRGCL